MSSNCSQVFLIVKSSWEYPNKLSFWRIVINSMLIFNLDGVENEGSSYSYSIDPKCANLNSFCSVKHCLHPKNGLSYIHSISYWIGIDGLLLRSGILYLWRKSSIFCFWKQELPKWDSCLELVMPNFWKCILPLISIVLSKRVQ